MKDRLCFVLAALVAPALVAGQQPGRGPAAGGSAQAGEYYVSPRGSMNGNGSRSRPWPSVEIALRRTGGGVTIVMLPGIYTGPVTIPRSASGRPDRPTVVRAEKKWEAAVVGSEHHAVFCEEGASWLVFDGLRVTGSLWNGFRIQGDHCVVRNCWIHNCGHMGISAHGRKGTLIERNLIEYNGRHPTQDHGVYADGPQITVRSNIVRHNSGYGICLYPAADESLVINNLVHGHTYRYGILVQAKKGENRIVYNTVVDDDGAIAVIGGRGNLVANNIALGRSATIHTRESPDVLLEGNLTNGDPGFVDLKKEVFWLRADARARGAAKPGVIEKLASQGVDWLTLRPEDCYGSSTARTDVGAFQYRQELERPEVRNDWPDGWPYQKGWSNTPDSGRQPDLWGMP